MEKKLFILANCLYCLFNSAFDAFQSTGISKIQLEVSEFASSGACCLLHFLCDF
jgi:hypothetical protein